MSDRERWLYIIGLIMFLAIMALLSQSIQSGVDNCKAVLNSGIADPAKAILVRETCR